MFLNRIDTQRIVFEMNKNNNKIIDCKSRDSTRFVIDNDSVNDSKFKKADIKMHVSHKSNIQIESNNNTRTAFDIQNYKNSELNVCKRVTSRSVNPLFLLLRITLCLAVSVKQWTLLCVLFTCVSAYREQKFAIEPQDQVSCIL